VILEETELPGVMVLRAPVHRDSRGFFTEVFHEGRFESLGLPTRYAQDNHSRSARHVLRGLHFQVGTPQGKLVRPVAGTIFDVAVDLRRSSPNFGAWVGVELEAGDGRQLWVPPGFAHGFLVTSDSADISYKCTTVYSAQLSRAIRWDDPAISVRWPLPPGVAPILSDADASAPALSSETWFE
jgi:dTDP-4-dehydrorhamnose 3,5-epimerase